MLQTPLFKPIGNWTAPNLAELPSWEGAKRVGFDLETCDPQLRKLGPGPRRDGRIVGVSFCIDGDRPYYLPFGHAAGGNINGDHVRQYLVDQAKVFTGGLVGANLQYEGDYLAEWGVHFDKVKWLDVQIAEPLLDENQFKFSLDAIAQRRGFKGKSEDVLRAAAEAYRIDPKKEMWKLPAKYVGEYAEEDARLPLQILEVQETLLREQNLYSVFELESEVLPVCLAMRRRGVKIDFDKLDQIETWSRNEELKALQEATRLSGVRLAMGDTTKASALAPAFESIGVKVPVTEKTKAPSIKEAWLSSIEHPLSTAVQRARKMNKIRNTFVASIHNHAIGDRIHCTFNQLKGDSLSGKDDETSGTVARLSSSNPNLQQQPARDPEIGPMWRSIFLPDDGGQWACLDYSQQEPRWLIHYAYRTRCRGADEAHKRYHDNPDTDGYSLMAELMAGGPQAWAALSKDEQKQVRSNSKTINLGLSYGMGGAKLCRSLGLPTEWYEDDQGRMREGAGREGRDMINRFNANVPYVKQFSKKTEKRARERGWVKTILGRRQRFPLDYTGKNYDWTYKAMNRVIQGSSADQMKTAMRDAHRAGIRLQLQVHDELDLTVWDRSEAEALSNIMRNAVHCEVPHKVDIEIGPNWGEIK